ncbi:hypothetical protein IC582_027386 [Cucumis melo]
MLLLIGATRRKKTEEVGGNAKVKLGKDVSRKRDKLSVSEMLASMGHKPDKPRKGSSSLSSGAKPRAKAPKKVASYTDGIDIPPSDEEEEIVSEEEQQSIGSQKRLPWQDKAEVKPLEVVASDKELKKPCCRTGPDGRL